jgi:DNA invertase Pin-like site-specific DNA recombinase
MAGTPAAAWYRVSTDEQDSGNQVPDVSAFAAHHGYDVVRRYEVSDSAWNRGTEYLATLKQAMDDAYAGQFEVLIVWSLDRLIREGAEQTRRLFRQFRQRGCTIVSVKESWLNGSPEVQDLLLAFAGWMAERESARRSERVKAGLERKEREDPAFRRGGKPGRSDRKPRKRGGYVARWEREREAAGA